MNRVTLALACSLLATSSATAQDIRNAGRVGLTTLPLRYQVINYERSADLFGEDGEEASDLLVGFGTPGFGINLGAVLGQGALLGAHALVVHQSAESSATATKMTAVEILPYFEYVFASSGAARGYLGGMAGISFADSDVGPATTTFVSGPTGGVHAFLGPNASLDLGAVALYFMGSAAEISVTGFTLAALVGVSAWWGGGTRQAEQQGASALAEARDEFGHAAPARPYAAAGAAPGADGAAERTFDRARNVHVLKARFGLGGASLLLVSMPQVELETVYVQLSVPRYAARPESCAALAALINDEPVQATGVTKSDERTLELGGRVVFERFKVLARPHATFGVEGCGQQWRLVESQMPELIKFLQLVSQVATDVQAGRLPRNAAGQPAPPAAQPGQPAVQPAPEAPAAPAAPAPGSSPAPTPDSASSRPGPE